MLWLVLQPERCSVGWASSRGCRDGPWAAGAGSGLGVGVPWAGRVGGNPCRERDCAVPTAGLWVPANDPAASPSSHRSKLKGRFMLSDPWGGGRLSAGIEAWHSSALLRSCRLSHTGLPSLGAAQPSPALLPRGRSSPGCAG